MKPGEASRTAEYNALFRAIESSRPRNRRLLDDPLAREFLDRSRLVYLLSRLPLIGRAIPFVMDWRWPGVRPSHIGRACWIDDRLQAALEKGIDQVVILAAGYDCRACRLASLKGRPVFEIDHPDTLAEKMNRLSRVTGSLPDNVTFIGADFARQDLGAVLDDSPFDRSSATFFLLEGLLHYLDEEGAGRLLRSISSVSAPGSQLVFTYVHRGLLDGSIDFGDMGRVQNTLQRSGETWTFGLYPEEVSGYLAGMGFTLLSEVGSVEYRATYLGSSGRHLKGFEFYRIALAEKSGSRL